VSSEQKDLIDVAKSARENAVAPFSNFKVGAALETASGKVFTGCNVENASYGLTVCAERVAIWKALSEGERVFSQIVVVADTDELTPPCGACRQIIWEFCGDVPVTLANLQGKSETVKMSALLPRAFGREFLG
jgi:cytidine deaminase